MDALGCRWEEAAQTIHVQLVYSNTHGQHSMHACTLVRGRGGPRARAAALQHDRLRNTGASRCRLAGSEREWKSRTGQLIDQGWGSISVGLARLPPFGSKGHAS